jgi:tetratricopeptide (TPR) repeat protein
MKSVTQGKLRLFEAILSLLRIPADERGLLVVIEDLHWADASTRELLDYLTRRLRSTRIMVLATYRNDELHRKHPLLPMVQGWRRMESAEVIELQPLPPAQVASMVSAIFDGETVGTEFRDFMHTQSDGNPFVIEELLKAALDRGDIFRSGSGWDRKSLADLKLPRTVRDTILLRVERLTSEQAEILRIAAVLGPSFNYQTLVAVSGRDPEAVKAALRACIQQQLMEEESEIDGRYRFRHALTREAIYEDMIAPDRMELHARAAEMLRGLAGTQAVDLAYHLLAAGHWDEAVPVSIKAAEDAERRRGYREAIELYGRVLPHLRDKLSRGRMICKLGNAHWLAGDPRTAQHHLEEGIALLEECGQKREAARYRLVLGRCHWELGRPKAARTEYEAARITLEPGGPSEDLANAYVRLAGLHLFDLEAAEAVADAERAVAVAEAAGVDPPRIWAYNFLGAGLCLLGRSAEGIPFLERSYREAAERDLEYIAMNAAGNMVSMLGQNFRPREALSKLDRMNAGGGWWPLYAGLSRGLVYWHLGEPQPARETLEKNLAGATEAEIGNVARRTRTALAIVYGMLNRFEEARRLLPETHPEVDRQDLFLEAFARIGIQLDSGDEEGAAQEAQRYLGLSSDRYPTPIELWAIDSAVAAFLRAARTAEATELVRRARAAGLQPDQPFVNRMEGRLARAAGDLEKARGPLKSAANFFGKVSYRTEERRTRRELARVLAALGDLTGAEAELRAVLQDAEEYGHTFGSSRRESSCASSDLR